MESIRPRIWPLAALALGLALAALVSAASFRLEASGAIRIGAVDVTWSAAGGLHIERAARAPERIIEVDY